jgi:hypothetical protein
MCVRDGRFAKAFHDRSRFNSVDACVHAASTHGVIARPASCTSVISSGPCKTASGCRRMGSICLVLVADYQTITDRDSSATLPGDVEELVADYLAVGIDPARATIFAHSLVPEFEIAEPSWCVTAACSERSCATAAPGLEPSPSKRSSR